MATFVESLFVNTLLAGFVSATIALLVSRSQKESDEKRDIDRAIEKLNELTIRYPQFEDDEFCRKWVQKRKAARLPIEYKRYESYCCMVFNLLERIWIFSKKDKRRANSILHIPELVFRHREWWLTPSGEFENVEGYSSEFRDFVSEYLSKHGPGETR